MNEIAEVASSVSLSAAEVESLRQWLKMNLPDKGQLKQVEKCDGGQSNPTYLLTMDDGQYIIRCKPGPAAQLLRSAHAIEREYRLMHALRNSDVPVPAVHVLCEDESVIGCAFYVMDFVDGRLFWDPSLPGLSKSERAAIYDRMNNVIATLHNLDPESIGLGDYGRGAGYLTRQVKRWTTQYRATQTESIPEMERLIQWLPENTPESDDTAIVHGDFRIDNLIFDHASEKVLAVLDWELSTLGHPLADFSYHCLSWHLSASRFGALGGRDLDALGIPQQQDYVIRYCERTGRDMATVTPDWNFFLAFNLFRLAGIAQGVTRRAMDGLASNQRAMDSKALIRPLAQAGWQAAKQR